MTDPRLILDYFSFPAPKSALSYSSLLPLKPPVWGARSGLRTNPGNVKCHCRQWITDEPAQTICPLAKEGWSPYKVSYLVSRELQGHSVITQNPLPLLSLLLVLHSPLNK